MRLSIASLCFVLLLGAKDIRADVLGSIICSTDTATVSPTIGTFSDFRFTTANTPGNVFNVTSFGLVGGLGNYNGTVTFGLYQTDYTGGNLLGSENLSFNITNGETQSVSFATLNSFNMSANQEYLVRLTYNANGNLRDTTTNFLNDNNASAVFQQAYNFNSTYGEYTANSVASVFAVTSVPEPGTMALGAIALASGGVGTWWRRRRKGNAASEV